MKKIALLLICLLPAFMLNAQRGINPRDRASQPVHYATQKAQSAPDLASVPLAKTFETNNVALKPDSVSWFEYTTSNDSTRWFNRKLRYTSDGTNYFMNIIPVTEKCHYTYVDTSRSFITESKDPVSSYRHTWKYKLEDKYDTSGNLTGQTVYAWDQSANDWVFDSKLEQHYGSAGNRPVFHDWFYTEMALHESVFTSEYYISRDNYSAFWAWHIDKPLYGTGYDTLSLKYKWDKDKSEWIPSQKRENKFDEHGYLTTLEYSNWSATENKWIQDVRQEFQHGADGLDTICKGQWLEADKADWKTDWADTLAYDEHGNMVQIIFTMWNKGKNILDYNTKVKYKYDVNNNFTGTNYYSYDTINREFVYLMDEFYHYDEAGNKIYYEEIAREGSPGYYHAKRFWYWSLTGVSSDASLWDVTASDGKLKAIINNQVANLFTVFNDETNDYIVLIDSSVTSSTLIVEKNDPNSSFVVNNATNIASANKADRTATVTVTAEDGTTTQDYSFEFHWIDHLATLDSLRVSEGTLSPEFSPDIFEYNDTLYGSCDEKIETPAITYKTTSAYANTLETKASNICGKIVVQRTSKITVTADDGVTKNTYKILFTVVEPNTINTSQTKDLVIYPNPSTDVIYIEHTRPICEVIVSNLMGQEVGRFETGYNQNYVLDLSGFRSGMYFIRVSDEKNSSYIQKVIKK